MKHTISYTHKSAILAALLTWNLLKCSTPGNPDIDCM
jgi:hypothetical protein